MRACYFCKFELDDKLEIFRATTCPHCGKDLKICKSCRFYTPGAHWDCAETVPEPVYDKEKSNFCDYFRFRSRSGSEPVRGNTKKKEAKNDFDKLFGS